LNFSSQGVSNDKYQQIPKQTRRDNKFSISIQEANLLLDQNKRLKKSFSKLPDNKNNINTTNTTNNIKNSNNKFKIKELSANEKIENSNGDSLKLFLNMVGSMSKTHLAYNQRSYSSRDKIDYLANQNMNMNEKFNNNSLLFTCNVISPSFPRRIEGVSGLNFNDDFTSNFLCSQLKLNDSKREVENNDNDLFRSFAFIETNNNFVNKTSSNKSLLFCNINNNINEKKSFKSQVCSLITNPKYVTEENRKSNQNGEGENFENECSSKATCEFFNFNSSMDWKGRKDSNSIDISFIINKKDYEDNDNISFNPKFLTEAFEKGNCKEQEKLIFDSAKNNKTKAISNVSFTINRKEGK